MGASASRVAVVTGNPNSPTGFGNTRIFTAVYTSGSSADTFPGVGPLKNGDFITILATQTNATSGYAGLTWDSATTVYSGNSGTVGIVPIATAPTGTVAYTLKIQSL